MKLSMHRAAALLFVLTAIPLAEADAASSSHARVAGGVGNVVLGESLPYAKDAAWKNTMASGSTVKLGDLKRWSAFNVRAFFAGNIGSIKGFEHERSKLILFLVVQPRGGKARVFADRLARAKAPAAYLARDSWGTLADGRHFHDGARGWGGVYVQDRPPLDPKDPETFLLEAGEIVDDLGKRLNTVWLSEILTRHGGATLTAYVKVFHFKGTGHRKAGGGEYVIDTDSAGRHEVKERFGIEEIERFDAGRLIARGRFEIVP